MAALRTLHWVVDPSGDRSYRRTRPDRGSARAVGRELPAFGNDAGRSWRCARSLGNGVSVRRIVGCPGGGKTHKLEELAQRAAGTYGASNVLAVSLTRTAAAEIGGRETGIPDENCAT